MSEDQVIIKKLNQIAKLLAIIVTKEHETQKEKVLLLGDIGFESDEIADVLGVEKQRVHEIRSRHKPKQAKKSREKNK